MTVNGQQQQRRTTTGCEFLLLCKDRLEQWILLKALNETNSVEVKSHC